MATQLLLSIECQEIVRAWAESKVGEHGVESDAEIDLINRLGGVVPDGLGGYYVDWQEQATQ